jgi:hypothetical protein
MFLKVKDNANAIACAEIRADRISPQKEQQGCR